MWTDDFLRYLAYERNYSVRTVGEYRDDLNAFEAFYREIDRFMGVSVSLG